MQKSLLSNNNGNVPHHNFKLFHNRYYLTMSWLNQRHSIYMPCIGGTMLFSLKVEGSVMYVDVYLMIPTIQIHDIMRSVFPLSTQLFHLTVMYRLLVFLTIIVCII